MHALAALLAAGQIHVVAAENMWGSLAAQLGGSRVRVTSVVASPAADPHDYEPTAVDARGFATAQLLIVNGDGYDAWASKLIAANPVSGRIVLTVGDLVGARTGGNPHLWYSPANVRTVAAAITRAYAKLDPTSTPYFRALESRFRTNALAQYDHLIAAIRRRFGGAPVGASESIFAPLARALGLRLLTPPSFLQAISEGSEPTAGDITTIDRQIARREIDVWVYNAQNSTPDVARLTSRARADRIPVVTITETLAPANATFEQWQVRQLKALELALARR